MKKSILTAATTMAMASQIADNVAPEEGGIPSPVRNGRGQRSKTDLTKKQRKVRAKNKMARKSRKINARKH